MVEKYGYWETSGLKFERKIDSLIYASQKGSEVKFVYHDSVWKNFDKSLLGKVSLKELYRARAQQLRDSYEYLILYYSGGADSHNVLMSFINNNIKLDEIIVKWPKALVDGKLYIPNTKDNTARNIWSEWNYTIKPSLDWLKSNHPDIKITIKDYAENITIKSFETTFETLNHTRAGVLQSFSTFGNDTIKKKIGHIFGIDKPSLIISGDDIFMFFNDLSTTMLYADKAHDADPNNIECFYWTPDMPLLAFEMAYRVAEYFVFNKDKRNFLQFGIDKSLTIQFQNNVSKAICYDTWDYTKFQADKPVSAIRQDKWFWFFECEEFKPLCEAFISNTINVTSQINGRYLTSLNSSAPGIVTLISNLYFVRKINP